MNRSQAWIHPEASVSGEAVIEPFAAIYGDVEIGAGTWVGPGAVIMDGARIGKDCKIYPGAVISAIPQDLKYKGESTTVEIGDRTTVREFVTINRGTSDRMKTAVGNDCLLMAYVHIAHDCLIGDHCIIANASTLAGHITMEDHVTLEGLVAVQQFIRIGSNAFVAGTSKVRKNIPPYIKAAREPLGYAGVNAIGLKRRGFSKEDIRKIEDIYRLLFVHNTNIGQGVESVKGKIEVSIYKTQILNFISESENGIIRGPLG
ncbi:MAG: acyl-ACP--UDP-N-acetylglucosamine O-acyltransferase [Flavobacteriales bacterium]